MQVEIEECESKVICTSLHSPLAHAALTNSKIPNAPGVHAYPGLYSLLGPRVRI